MILVFVCFSSFVAKMLLFVNDVADLIQLHSTTVITLELQHGLMDVIHWIEPNRFPMVDFDIISLMVGRGEITHSGPFFTACLDEVIRVLRKKNSSALLLLGAVIPSMRDDHRMVREFVTRNAIIQGRCMGKERRTMEYTIPGRVLLTRGGPIPEFFNSQGRLNDKGCERFTQAVYDKFESVDLHTRARNVRH